MGTSEYGPLVEKFGVPIVVSGFEPLDLLEGVRQLVDLLEDGQGRTAQRLPAGGQRRRQHRRPADAGRRVRRDRPTVAGHRHDPEVRLDAVAALRRSSTPSSSSGSVTCRCRNPPNATPARCCRACSSPTSARPSARPARRAPRWAPPWCPARARARPTTSSAGWKPRIGGACLTTLGRHRPVGLGVPAAAARDQTHRARSRRWRHPVRGTDREPVPARVRLRRADRRGTRRCSTVAAGRIALTTDSYVVQPVVLPRRQHRRSGRQRHHQRPGDERGAAAGADGRVHPRGGSRTRGARCRRAVDGQGRRRRRCRHRHRRHQGRRKGQRRPAFHQHRRRRRGSRRACASDPSRPAPATTSSSRATSASTAWRS